MRSACQQKQPPYDASSLSSSTSCDTASCSSTSSSRGEEDNDNNIVTVGSTILHQHGRRRRWRRRRRSTSGSCSRGRWWLGFSSSTSTSGMYLILLPLLVSMLFFLIMTVQPRFLWNCSSWWWDDDDGKQQHTPKTSSGTISSTSHISIAITPFQSPLSESVQARCRPSSMVLYKNSDDANNDADDKDDTDNDDTMHVLFGLSGDDPGFLAEFHVALKSVLLNAPLTTTTTTTRQPQPQNPAGLIVHVMADHPQAVQASLDSLQLHHWKMRIPVVIQVHAVTDTMLTAWTDKVDDTMTGIIRELFWSSSSWGGFKRIPVYRHTIGQYFRLFFHEMLLPPPQQQQPIEQQTISSSSSLASSSWDVHNTTAMQKIPSLLSPRHPIKHVLYLDTDAVVMANLGGVWKLRNDTLAFQWGAEMVSAFMLLNVNQLRDLWRIYQTVPPAHVKHIMDNVLRGRHVADDQMLLQVVNVTHPHNVGILPTPWDISYLDGPWWATGDNPAHYHRPEFMSAYRPTIGMLHFNGGGASKESYFVQHEVFQKNSVQQPRLRRNQQQQQEQHEMIAKSWGQAKYYIDMSWYQARFLVENQVVDDECYQLELLHG